MRMSCVQVLILGLERREDTANGIRGEAKGQSLTWPQYLDISRRDSHLKNRKKKNESPRNYTCQKRNHPDFNPKICLVHLANLQNTVFSTSLQVWFQFQVGSLHNNCSKILCETSWRPGREVRNSGSDWKRLTMFQSILGSLVKTSSEGWAAFSPGHTDSNGCQQMFLVRQEINIVFRFKKTRISTLKRKILFSLNCTKVDLFLFLFLFLSLSLIYLLKWGKINN